jgi:hypothetical protein
MLRRPLKEKEREIPIFEVSTLKCKKKCFVSTEEKEQLISIFKQPGIYDTYIYMHPDGRFRVLKSGIWYNL